jgi:hypothetical protein
MLGAILGSQTVLRSLRDAGSLDGAHDQLAPWEERQRLARKAIYDELEHHYRAERFALHGQHNATQTTKMDRSEQLPTGSRIVSSSNTHSHKEGSSK